MEITAALGLTLAAFIGTLAGSLLTSNLAYRQHKAELRERRRHEKIKYLQKIVEELILWRSELTAHRIDAVHEKARLNIEGLLYSVDDSKIQSLMQHVPRIETSEVATDGLIRLGEMINEEMQISPVKTVRRWFWQ
ncbi:hypothetical protein C8B47_03755 [filamentous cyanobacterium CCP4]|nr:hypothetical protein C8B47_03755 [filamentous cyanobacterium CCP4]